MWYPRLAQSIYIFFCLFVAAASAQLPTSVPAPTLYGGDYNYTRDGQYRSITDPAVNALFDTLGTASTVVHDTQNILNQAGSFALWRSENPRDGFAAASGGIGLQLQGPFQTQALLGPQSARSQWFAYKLGPFYIDNLYATTGVIYSDYQGNSPFGGFSGVPGGDNWAMAVGLSARISFNISDRFAFTASPFVYWLPLQNEVGWAVGFPGYALLGGLVAPQALLETAYRIPIEGGLELTFVDRFSALYLQTNLLNESLLYQLNFLDTTPVDRAGRYQFGVGSVPFDSTGNPNFSINSSPFSSDKLLYQNQFGAFLRGRHGEGLYSNTYYNRYDWWDKSFDHINAWNVFGAVLIKEGAFLSPYVMYEANVQESTRLGYHQALAGVNAKLNPNTIAYAQAGWLWTRSGVATPSQSSDGWIAQAGMRQRLGPYTVHGLDVGRAPFQAGFGGVRFVSDFVRYYVSQQIGARITTNFYIEKADLKSLGQTNGDREFLTAGAMTMLTLSDKSRLGLFVTYDNIDLPRLNRGWQMWTYRAVYMRQLSDSIQGQIAYHYQQAGSGRTALDHFQEHFLFFGVTKRF
ncbi:MAG: hypothetical protein R3F13_02465 [Prosthecobacter sp.]